MTTETDDSQLLPVPSKVNALRSMFIDLINDGPRARSQSVPCDMRPSDPANGRSEPADQDTINRFRQARELFKRLDAEASNAGVPLPQQRRLSDCDLTESDFLHRNDEAAVSPEVDQFAHRLQTCCPNEQAEEGDDLNMTEQKPVSASQTTGSTTKKTVQFSNAPIKVYETYSASDYDRRNDSIDPMAASAEYELEKRIENMDLFTVNLKKARPSDNLGFAIIGIGIGADAGIERLGMFIKSIDNQANDYKRLEVGDQIIEVNGVSLVGVTQNFAASLLRQTSGDIELLMGRERDRTDSEILKLIQESLEMEEQQNRWSEDNSANYTPEYDHSNEDQYRALQETKRNELQFNKMGEMRHEVVLLRRQVQELECVKERNILLEQQIANCERKIADMEQLLGVFNREKNELQAQIVFYQRQCADLENKYLRAREALLDDLRRREINSQRSSPVVLSFERQPERSTMEKPMLYEKRSFMCTPVAVPVHVQYEKEPNFSVDADSSSSPGEEHSFPLTLDEGCISLVEDDLVVPQNPQENHITKDLPAESESAEAEAMNGKGASLNIQPAGLDSLVESSRILIAGTGDSGLTKFLIQDAREKRPNSAPPDNRIRPKTGLGLPLSRWTVEDVKQWMISQNMSNYVESFVKSDIDGPRLLRLDSSKLKSLGIKSSKDRDYFKSRLKELKERDYSRLMSPFKLPGAVAAFLRPKRS